jgi:hypothetical protein
MHTDLQQAITGRAFFFLCELRVIKNKVIMHVLDLDVCETIGQTKTMS